MNVFTQFVSTLKEDLQAIRGDLDEFVTTVREDASAVLGVDLSAPPPNTGRFEDTLRERPELLCEPLPAGSVVDKDLSARKDEIEKLLGGLDGPLIPELYRELVPSRITHQEFFERLFFYRAQYLSATRLKMQGSLRQPETEELEGWDDDVNDDEDNGAHRARTTREGDDDHDDEENPVASPTAEIEKLQKRVAELERLLEVSERQREELERQLAASRNKTLGAEDGASTKSWEAVSGSEPEATTDAPVVHMNDSGLGDWE